MNATQRQNLLRGDDKNKAKRNDTTAGSVLWVSGLLCVYMDSLSLSMFFKNLQWTKEAVMANLEH